MDNYNVNTSETNVTGSTGYTDGRGVNFSSGSVDIEGRESWRSMVENLYTDMTGLWDRQSMLIRTEMNEKISDIKTASVSLGAGSVMMVVGVFCLAATAIICLDLVLPLWASAVIVTALFFIVGGIMLVTAKKKLDADKLKPRHSIETFGEISTTFKERLYDFKKH